MTEFQPPSPEPSFPSFSGDIIAPAPSKSRRVGPAVASAVAVLAIVVAGGGFAAYRMLASSGSQPDAWAPANSIAYVKVDLDPSTSAKISAWRFEQKFPDAPKVASADELKDALLQAAITDREGQADYATDIKPWLGDRAAVAEFLDSSGKPQTVAILAVKNSAAAKADIQRLNAKATTPMGYSIEGSYALLANSQSIVDQAVDAARKGNIDNNSTYSKDIAHLQGDRIVTGWWDAGATMKAASSDLPGQAGGLIASSSMLGLPDLTKVGRIVFGVRVEPSDVVVDGRLVGGASSTSFSNGNAGQFLGQLPGGTVAGVALADPEGIVKTALDSAQKSLAGASLNNEFDALGAQLGIAVPADVENLLGSGLAVGLDALSGDPEHSDNFFTAITHPDDPAKALTTAQALTRFAASSGAPALRAAATGDTITVTDDARPATGHLSDDPAFTAALSGMPAHSVIAGFVNIGAIASAVPTAPSGATHLGSVGFYVGADSTSPVFSLKLTVK